MLAVRREVRLAAAEVGRTKKLSRTFPVSTICIALSPKYIRDDSPNISRLQNKFQANFFFSSTIPSAVMF